MAPKGFNHNCVNPSHQFGLAKLGGFKKIPNLSTSVSLVGDNRVGFGSFLFIFLNPTPLYLIKAIGV